MNPESPLVLLTPLGLLTVPQAVWTTWIVMVILLLASVLLTRNLKFKPGKSQVVLEGIITTMAKAIEAVSPDYWQKLFPFIATLWLFVLTSNLFGIIPEMKAPTANLSTTSALAVLVFLSVHWFTLQKVGLKSYLHHYFSPTPIMLPFHIISEISRTIALAVRLFGNMMSLEMAAMMILIVAGFLVPVPLLMLHVVEALVQAYIFGMLALIYIASGIESQHHKKEETSSGAH